MGLPTDPCHPWSFAMAQSAIAVADHELAAAAVPVTAAEVRDDLLKLFGSVPDGRSGQGRDHPVGAVLALAAAAVVAGMKGYTAIAGWVKDVPLLALADLYMRAGASPARPPSKATIWRGLTAADAGGFHAPAGQAAISSPLPRLAAPSRALAAGQGKPAAV